MEKFRKPIIEVIELENDKIIFCSDGGYTPGTNPPEDLPDDFWD